MAMANDDANTEMSQLGDATEMSGSTKRMKTSPPYLVLCLTGYPEYFNDPVSFEFECYSIEKLIHSSSQPILPDYVYTWPEKVDDPDKLIDTPPPPFRSMGLVNTGSSLLAIGGNEPFPGFVKLQPPYDNLPPHVYAATLSSTPVPKPPLSGFRRIGQMNGGKYSPIIECIKGRVCVLSTSDIFFSCPVIHPFEVYDPETNEWASQQVPIPRYDYIFRSRGTFVVGSKLYVTTANGVAHTYDVEKNKWAPTELFKEFLEKAFPEMDYGFTSPFPFAGKPHVHKGKFLLCSGPSYLTPFLAFELIDMKKRKLTWFTRMGTEEMFEEVDDQTAVEVPFTLDQTLESGFVEDIIHLKDDYYVIMVRDVKETVDDMLLSLTMVIFKLKEEMEDGRVKAFSGEVISKHDCVVRELELRHAYVWQ